MENSVEGFLVLFGRALLRYFILAGIPFLLIYVLFPGKFQLRKIQQRLAVRKDFFREIWHSLQSTVIFAAIAGVLLYTPLKQYTLVYDHLHQYPIWYTILSVPLSLLVHDTYFYWMHRMLHHKKLFKMAHVVHHQSTNPSPWASYSFHVLEAVAEGGILVVLLMIIPMHPLAILGFTLSGFIINVYGHMGYEIMPRALRHSWLFEVINTSVHHNLHHSRFKGNYGLYLRVWDRLMGTEHPDYVKEYDRVQAQRFPAAPPMVETPQQIPRSA